MNFLSGMNGLGFILVGESENDIHIFSDPLVLFPMALVSPVHTLLRTFSVKRVILRLLRVQYLGQC